MVGAAVVSGGVEAAANEEILLEAEVRTVIRLQDVRCVPRLTVADTERLFASLRSATTDVETAAAVQVAIIHEVRDAAEVLRRGAGRQGRSRLCGMLIAHADEATPAGGFRDGVADLLKLSDVQLAEKSGSLLNDFVAADEMPPVREYLEQIQVLDAVRRRRAGELVPLKPTTSFGIVLMELAPASPEVAVKRVVVRLIAGEYALPFASELLGTYGAAGRSTAVSYARSLARRHEDLPKGVSHFMNYLVSVTPVMDRASLEAASELVERGEASAPSASGRLGAAVHRRLKDIEAADADK